MGVRLMMGLLMVLVPLRRIHDFNFPDESLQEILRETVFFEYLAHSLVQILHLLSFCDELVLPVK